MILKVYLFAVQAGHAGPIVIEIYRALPWAEGRITSTIRMQLRIKTYQHISTASHYIKKYDIALGCTKVSIIAGICGSNSQSHIATDSQSVSKSRCRASSGAHGQILITL
jgi:hypothetical protein